MALILRLQGGDDDVFANLAFTGNLAEHIFVKQFFQFNERVHAVVHAIQHEENTQAQHQPEQAGHGQAFFELGGVRKTVAGGLVYGDAFGADLLIDVQRLHRGEQLIVECLHAVGLGLQAGVGGGFAADLQILLAALFGLGFQILNLQRERALTGIQLFHALRPVNIQHPPQLRNFLIERDHLRMFGLEKFRIAIAVGLQQQNLLFNGQVFRADHVGCDLAIHVDIIIGNAIGAGRLRGLRPFQQQALIQRHGVQ